MQKIQLKENELIVGKPLPWPVYGHDDELLLDKGKSLESERQKHILLTRGLFREANDQEARQLEKQEKFSLSSPFNVLDAIRLNVTRILEDMKNSVASNYNHRVIRVATAVQKLCFENADAALGALILDQQAFYTQVHPIMCSVLTELLLRRKKIPKQDRLLYIASALTQNIGMLELQESLYKQSSPLTEQQHIAVKKHPYLSREILQGLGVDHKEWLGTIQNHHERPDGSGYPNSLQGDEISLYARILSLTDIYSAMVLPRQYRDGYFIKKALRDIFMQRGGSVDKKLTQLLIKELGICPPGTFVKLANGDTAIVIHRGVKQANSPMVLSILSPGGAPYNNPQRKDTKYQELYGIVKIIPRIDDLKLDRNQIWGLGKK
jgi:HD-GYP domain-containing protein (c-di-GMP phosphodiesterase class II)